MLFEGAQSTFATASGHPCNASDPGAFVYLAPQTFSVIRFPATPEAFQSFELWTSYTPLKEGTTLAQPNTQLNRDPDTGALIYGWKFNTGALALDEEQALIDSGEMTLDE